LFLLLATKSYDDIPVPARKNQVANRTTHLEAREITE